MARFAVDDPNNGRAFPITADVEDLFQFVGSGSLVSIERSGGGAALSMDNSCQLGFKRLDQILRAMTELSIRREWSHPLPLLRWWRPRLGQCQMVDR